MPAASRLSLICRLITVCGLTAVMTAAHAALDLDLVYHLKASVVKIHTVTPSGGHGVGSGVVVAKDTVATNCHVLANSQGVNITKFGDSFSPVGMIADWRHDICLLKFQYLELPAVKLASTAALHYGDDVFSIGFPGGPPKPQTIPGKVRALYSYDNSLVVRSDAAFIMGSSGSPTFNAAGELVSLSTFKSPGKGAYFYSVPVEWIQALLDKPLTTVSTPDAVPFWDLPLEQRPWWMQVVLPYQNADWSTLETIAKQWVSASPNDAEAQFYLASALHGQGRLEDARAHYQAAVSAQPRHQDAWLGLAMLAQQLQQPPLLADAEQHLKSLDPDGWPELAQRLKPAQQ